MAFSLANQTSVSIPLPHRQIYHHNGNNVAKGGASLEEPDKYDSMGMSHCAHISIGKSFQVQMKNATN